MMLLTLLLICPYSFFPSSHDSSLPMLLSLLPWSHPPLTLTLGEAPPLSVPPIVRQICQYPSLHILTLTDKLGLVPDSGALLCQLSHFLPYIIVFPICWMISKHPNMVQLLSF